MIFVKDNDPLYPSFIISNSTRSLLPSEEHLSKLEPLDRNQGMLMHVEQPNLKENLIDRLDIRDTIVLPTIHETLATPIEQKNSKSAVAYSSQITSFSPSCDPSRASQQRPAVSLPVTYDTQHQSTLPSQDDKDTIIKTGRLLCCKSSIWYTGRQQRTLHKLQREREQQSAPVQRQMTRLEWREFRAVLKPHCLELYLESPLLLHGPRLAHVVYFSYCTQHQRHHHHHRSPASNSNSKPWYRTKWMPRSLKESDFKTWRYQRRQHKIRYQPRISTARLSIASMADYTLRLEYLNKTGGSTTFLLQAQTASHSQDWYMALYHQISMQYTDTLYTPLHIVNSQPSQREERRHRNSTKRPIPAYIDVTIPCLQDKDGQNGNTASPKTFVRVPLGLVIGQDSHCVIRASDLKLCLLKLLNDANIQSGCRHATMTPNMMSLCWRYGHRIEWLSDATCLIGPQLIEQRHTLELRSICPEIGQSLESPVTMEGFLIQSTNNNGQFKHKHQQTRMYTLMEGQYLFFIDPSKAVLPNQQEYKRRGWSLNWLSAATLMNLHPRRYGNTRKHQRRDNHHHHHSFFQSVPGFFTKPSASASQQGNRSSLFFRHRKHSNPEHTQELPPRSVNRIPRGRSDCDGNNSEDDNGHENDQNDAMERAHEEDLRIADMLRRAGQVSCAYAVIDLSFVDRIQPVRIKNSDSVPPTTTNSRAGTATTSSPFTILPRSLSGNSSSSLSIQLLKTEVDKRRKRLFELVMEDGTKIQLEASSAQAMFEWVQRIRRGINYGKDCRSKGVILSQAVSSLWYRNIHKTILQSGILYVRKGSQKTYRRYLCVLSRGRGLILYRYSRYGIMSKRRAIRLQSSSNSNGLLTKSNSKSTYAYGMDHPMDLKSDDGPASIMTIDGERTRQEVYQCAFVIWQRYTLSKSHFIMQLKEHISLLKLGHRLGRKGQQFIFLASSVEEKEAWLWAIQQELEK